MCGLVGMAGNLDLNTNKAFRNLLVMDQVRGWHSTGVGIVNYKGCMEVVTEVGTPDKLFAGSGKFNHKGILTSWPKVVIGHNRAATTGKINKDNAHPFTFDHITGAHNGTLSDWFNLEGYKDFEVDSKALFKTIADKGIKHCWKNFRGAAAITWWDEKEDTLNFIRNKERPLWLATVAKGSILVWASEKWMLEAACNSCNLTIDEAGGKISNPWQLKENYIHTYNVSNVSISLKKCEELAVMPQTVYNMGYWNRKDLSNKVSNTPLFFNRGWAKNLQKAGKNTVGLSFTLSQTISFQGKTGGMLYVLQGFTEDKKLIQIIPSSYTEWSELGQLIRTPEYKDVKYKLLRRPRYIESISKEKGVETYRISLNHTTVLGKVKALPTKVEPEKKDNVVTMYKGPHNRLTENREEAQFALDKDMGKCCYCDKDLFVEDDYHYGFYGVVCYSCHKHDEMFDGEFKYGDGWMN